MFIIKRDGSEEEFQKGKVINAIASAFSDVKDVELDMKLCSDIGRNIEEEAKYHEDFMGRSFTIEQVQDMVESELVHADQGKVVKAFILYREKHKQIRERWHPYKKFKYLSKEFLRDYARDPNPFDSELSKFTFYRTYSRFIKGVNRRETWLEMNARVVDYMIELDPKGNSEKAEELFDLMYHFKVFSSGRIRYTGGTESIERNFQSAFNCSYVTMDDIFNLVDAMYLLMLGSGVGYRILKEDVEKIQPVRQDIEIIHKDYQPVPRLDRQELTTTTLNNNSILEIVVGDSKRGWTESLKTYLEFLVNYKASSSDNLVKTILFNYDNVRPAGEILKTFGGTASGHIPLKESFSGIDKIVKNSNGNKLTRHRIKLKPIDMLDMNGLIAEAIVVGGVRRAAEIALVSADDYETRNAKTNLYTEVNGKWQMDTSIKHRQMSNNTILYKKKPAREALHEHVQTMRISGEPGIANLEEIQRRKPDAEGLNPCAEILLKSKQHCNLTIISMLSFLDESGGVLYDELEQSIEWATYIAFIVSLQELDLLEWDDVAREDRIIGVSMTGYQDFINKGNISQDEKKKLLKFMRSVANNMNEELAKKYNVTKAELVTTAQPAGTVSILPNSASSGIHWSHSPFYIRRVRVSAKDPVAMSMIDSGFEWKPEVGQTREEHSTKVFEFPVKAPKGRTKYDVGAIEQLNEYKLLMEEFVDHNASITVHVREDEWDLVEEWLWDNWDCFVGISFLSLDDSFYDLLPFESITEDEYNEMVQELPKFDEELLSDYEDGSDFEIDDGAGCDGPHGCPVR